jgi:hypothetical protein
LVRRYLLPRWGKLQAKNIARSDVRAMMAKIAAPVLANQVLAAASAVFSWGVKQEVISVDPCAKVDRNRPGAGSASCRTAKSRSFGRRSTPRDWCAHRH